MTKEKKRISGKNISIKDFQKEIKNFFDGRSMKVDPKNPYISVIYQDSNPDLAMQRDKSEKEFIYPKLLLKGHSKVLDVGCGIGRWADLIFDKVERYIGIDFSEELIKIARSRYQNSSDFHILPAQEVSPTLLNVPEKYFDRVIVAGVFLYMDDEDIIDFFSKCRKLVSENVIFYIREPLAIKERLTLKGVWSDELQQYYYSVYRTKEEMKKLICAGFGIPLNFNFKLLYEDSKLNNREETMQFYTIFGIN